MTDLIPIKIYAAQHGVDPANIRQKIARGCLPEAVKLGRDWFIPAGTPYTDARVTTGQYKNWRKKP